ncbi:hypothetical protein Droror1_Dr00016930 [Drosera rotundifolia]
MGEERRAFYVVRKGDVIGVYTNLADCQAQAGYSPSNPSVTVYKGYGLSKEAEAFLASRGLKNASHTMAASEVQNGLFGSLAICPFQDASSSSLSSCKSTKEQLSLGVQAVPVNARPSLHAVYNHNNSIKLENHVIPQGPGQNDYPFCIIEFDGASKGNPGPAGAGAIVRAENGTVVWRLREGVGIATNNVAEYRGVILGLKYALNRGYKHVRVRGDSLLVCKQIEGLWKTKNQNMADLCGVAKDLKNRFVSFRIEHVMREFNSEADAQANKALNLRDGEIEVDFENPGMHRAR